MRGTACHSVQLCVCSLALGLAVGLSQPFQLWRAGLPSVALSASQAVASPPGARAPGRASSVLAAPELSCPTARGIFPELWIELMSPALAGGFLTALKYQGSPCHSFKRWCPGWKRSTHITIVACKALTSWMSGLTSGRVRLLRALWLFQPCVLGSLSPLVCQSVRPPPYEALEGV